MIDQNTVLEIWRKTPHDVSKADVEFILAEYEKHKNSAVVAPRDTSLREGEIYVLANSYNNSEEEYSTIQALQDELLKQAKYNNWDECDIDDSFTIYIRREEPVTFVVESVLSFKLT